MSLRGRMILIGAVALLAIALAFPNVFSEQQRLDSDLIPDQGVTLGLDLQGGVHWLLRIDAEKATHDELVASVDRLREAAATDGIGFSSIEVTPEGDAILVRGAVELSFREFVSSRFDTLQVDGGEAELRLTLTEPWRRSVIDRGVRQALDVLNRRIDDTGVREPIIAPQGEGRILVQLPGDIDPRRARELITRTTFLEFKKVLDAAPNEDLLLARYPGGLPADSEIVVARTDEVVSEALLVEAKAVLTGSMLQDARVSFDRRGRALVLFTWDSQGTELFREFTAANIGQRMAAIIDGESVTAPTIQARIGQRGQIEGAFTQQEAADLAVALRSGALPIPLVIEEERTVGPALGADSIRNGLRSISIGGLAVVIFMGVYYSVAGALANVALILNVIIIIGLMSFARATLTLPGIAGLVLTVGMAVDANVIIFERIREELRAGRPLRNAVQMGFTRSRLTILDANITTMIAAVVLLWFGRGPVQGFGVTLAIGIFSSVFCALVVTRLLVDVAISRSERLRI